MAFDDDRRLQSVQSRDGRAARDALIKAAKTKKYHLSCGGTAVPHIQFRQHSDERPYSFSLLLNPVTPTFYIRRPAKSERENILGTFEGAHENPAREIKIPVPDATVAERIAKRFL